MKDEEFKRRLESILANLYKIDQEVKRYFGDQKYDVNNGNYLNKSYPEKSSINTYKNKPEYKKIDNKEQ
jgi:hypothetical protein